jgi:competence protein ComEA
MKHMLPVLALCLALASFGRTVTVEAAPPAPLQLEQVTAAFAPGPGRSETVAACGACHSPSLITGKRFNADAWAQIVDQMIGRGAPVADKDYDAIVDYLSRNYGPTSG